MGRLKDRAMASEDQASGAAILGELARDNIDVFCWCNRCGHNASVAIGLLMRQFGPAFPVPEVGARMRCTGCGSKDIATRPAWPSLGQVARHTE